MDAIDYKLTKENLYDVKRLEQKSTNHKFSLIDAIIIVKNCTKEQSHHQGEHKKHISSGKRNTL